jgi:hypothetical protein
MVNRDFMEEANVIRLTLKGLHRWSIMRGDPDARCAGETLVILGQTMPRRGVKRSGNLLGAASPQNHRGRVNVGPANCPIRCVSEGRRRPFRAGRPLGQRARSPGLTSDTQPIKGPPRPPASSSGAPRSKTPAGVRSSKIAEPIHLSYAG